MTDPYPRTRNASRPCEHEASGRSRRSKRRRCFALALSGLVIVGTLTGTTAAQEGASVETIIPPVQPLSVTVDEESIRSSPSRSLRAVPEGEPLPTAPPPQRAPVADPVIQTLGDDALGEAILPDQLSDPDVNVAGLTAAANPPDPVGDIGPNHYVQMVNVTQFQIFDTNGSSVFGPADFGALWPASATCGTNTGDPIVVYDHLADRWLLSQFAFPSHMCIAISQTPDPTAGTWHLYTFNVGVFPDYPKFGVWPDGYYMSSFEGANLGVYVLDRANMVLGAAASGFKTTIPALGATGVRATRILPSDLDGPPPPAGTPNFFLRTVDGQQDPANPADRIEVYEFAVDWATPSFSFSLADTLAPAPFQIMLCNRNGGLTRDCIPQPGTTSTVDALSNRPMMQLKYRNFDSFAAMVVNQTIDVSGSIPGVTPVNEVAGIRWYELRNSGANWTIHQEGTYAAQPAGVDTEPELLHRWMGSMAIDQDGNIALGYSIVNDDDGNPVYPGIRYTGRRVGDPLGMLPEPEKIIANGTNSQLSGFGGRWGDYSALSVDPDDDCTFWFTQHLAGIGGTGARPTRIGSFRFASCGQAPEVIADDTGIDHNWKTVSLPVTFLDPIVVAGPPTFDGTQPGLVRLRNVTGTDFQVRFQEWDYLDGTHIQENLPYLVLDAGRHVMPDGSIWEAGSFPLGGTAAWQSEVFSQPFAAPPALFLTVQTFNGSQAATVRARNVTVSGFEAALFEQEALMDGHVVEEVGYLAIHSPAGSGEIDVSGTLTPYLLQSPSVDQRFAPVLSSALKVEEEQSQDMELVHTKETLSVLVLGDQIFAQDVSSTGSDSAALRRLAPEYTAPIEWGTVDGVTHDWTTVPLAKSFTNPVVVAKPVSANGAQPGVIRVRNVTGGSFELRYQEWLYLDGAHIAERVFYLVAEAGQFTTAGAVLDVEAGRLNSSLLLSGGFQTVTFSTAFVDPPAVFTGVMTANGSDPVITRVDGLTATSFFLTMDEEEARRAGGHATETLGWIAIERGSGTTADGRNVAVSQTTADDQPAARSLGLSANRQFPVMVGDVISTKGSDPVFLRYRNLTPSSVELFLQEEQSLDLETTHTLEDVSIFAAE